MGEEKAISDGICARKEGKWIPVTATSEIVRERGDICNDFFKLERCEIWCQFQSNCQGLICSMSVGQDLEDGQ